MSNSINNLEKLTDQIYQEGIEKAEKQSQKMLQEAEAEKAVILNNAKAEAESILEEAQREAKRLQHSVESELNLKAKQFISDLKAKIEGLLSQKIIETTTKEALADVDFMQSAITDVLKHWKETNDLELILPKGLEDKLNGAFVRRIKELTPNMTITFESTLNGGFRIAKKADNYQISFSDDDFIEIFKSYLSEQTNKVLFKTSQ
ncbi:V-type ATP synthase subunit E [Paucihalobacter ruber]|uniref:V-type ATP synthase subunit E n=1 Tax=Paucihalobacter ruber TaxID=2567861 RepID=A0A506PT38_9FLAO|nr:V-type ATP synthase subunit E [Paucihalobacter ruber]TPV35390.1 V-type ATP synthase subunit E [Paucihalobacter ruber]